jgi:hypothetical protein
MRIFTLRNHPNKGMLPSLSSWNFNSIQEFITFLKRVNIGIKRVNIGRERPYIYVPNSCVKRVFGNLNSRSNDIWPFQIK